MKGILDLETAKPSVMTQVTIREGSYHNYKSGLMYSELKHLMLALHDGQDVSARIYGSDNLMFYTSAEQIDRGAQRLREVWDKCYLGTRFEAKVRDIKSRFGSSKLAMTLSLLDIAQTPDDVRQLLAEYEMA